MDVESPYVHYYNRGVNRARIFFINENYDYLIKLLHKYLVYYQVELMAYCLMPNHYHILLKHESPLEGSRFIQRTFNSYTQSVNKQQSRVGTLFQGNVKKRIIDAEDYLVECILYIHLNPVKKGYCTHPRDWKYSDFSEWVGLRQGTRNVDKICAEVFGSVENYQEMIDIELENNAE